MNSVFTDSFASNEVSSALNFSLSNQNQYAETRNESERSESTSRQYEVLPFASTETTFSTNPFLPRMTDPSGLLTSWHNNIMAQNDQPTYLASSYDSFSNVESPAVNSSRNTLSTNQNLGLASSSSNLNPQLWEQPRQSGWSSNSGLVHSTAHSPRTTQWQPHLSNQVYNHSSGRMNFLTRANNSGTVLTSWANSSNNQYHQPIYLPNNIGYYGQSQLNPNFGRIKFWTQTEHFGSNPGLILCRNNGIGISMDHSLQSRSFCQGSCRHQYRSHPYMSIVPSPHNAQLNFEVNSIRLGTQNRRSVSDLNRGLPPFESLNLPAATREVNEPTTWVNPTITIGIVNNSFAPSYSTNEVANRGITQVEDPFSIDLTVDESISVDNLRPSISLADVESIPNLIRTVQAGSNHPQSERTEYSITNLSNQNNINNSILHHPRTNSVRNTFVETATYGSSLDAFENQRRLVRNHIRRQRRTSGNGTRRRQRQTENVLNSRSFTHLNASYCRKLEVFRSQLKLPIGVPKNFEIKIKRSSIFEDSYRIITSVGNVENLKAKLWVVFEGETGLDYGGVQREWFCLLSREIFNPNYGFFEYCKTSNYSLQINPNSGICNEEHLNYFMFIGRIVGMAVYHEKLLDTYFTSTFYTMLLQKKITLEDVKTVDPQFYQTLSWIYQNDPSSLDLDFSVNEERLGQICQVELIPNGSKLPVTNQNKYSYIDLFLNWMFVSRVKDQMEAFLMGFHDLIPKKSIKLFSESELESLFCGRQQIDIKDWKSNTAYSGGYYSTHVTIKWFWKLVKTFNNEMRSKLLQFVTGTSKVPMNGFKELIGSNGPLLFTIQKIGTTDSLPRAHTCFNRLDLPPYESFEQLQEKLIYAIECCEGFGGVD